MTAINPPSFSSEMPNLASDSTGELLDRPINVMIADDHNLIRFAMRKVLEKLDNINLVGEAESVDEGKSILDNGDVDIMVVDLNLISSQGLDLVRYCQNKNKLVKTIVLTSSEDDASIQDAMSLGVHAYCSKNILLQIGGIIRHVANNGLWFDPAIGAKIMAYFNQARTMESVRSANTAANGTLEELTAVEHSILEAYAKGHSIREVSDMLNFSPNTIKVYSSRLYKKLGVANRGQALRTVYGQATV